MAYLSSQRLQFGDETQISQTDALDRSGSELEKHWTNDVEVGQVTSADAEDPDCKKKQEHRGWVLLWLAYQSVGVIYGDIGTSPLYVYSSTFTSQPSWDDLVGALSIIIWSLTLIVTVKYVFIVLRADDDGEGGTFALYSLLARYANIVRRDPNVAGTVKMERYLTSEMKPVGKNVRSFIEHSRVARTVLKVIGVLGVSMVMADGVLTPAQSVLGAIQGISVVSPGISTATIVGSSCAILVVLFAVQPFGTHRIASAWAPIVIVWLLFNFCSGVYNLAKYDYTVLKAFSPFFAGSYLVRNKKQGWRSLGGLLLAFTGVEAMFADLGAFSRHSINLSWLCLAYPCLLMAYIGQAAFISQDATGTAYTNPFFNTVPPHTIWFALIIAILAAIVASQAMITSSFQLLAQIMRMSYFPHIKTVHTSKRFHGQLYMPLANWLLMIGTVIVTAVYNNTTSLGNAYGVCVIFVTFITTCMVTLVALIIWRINFLIVLFVFLVFACLDGVYVSSVLTKVPQGAWFTLMLAFILSTLFILWRYGKEQQWSAEGEDRFQPSHFVVAAENGDLRLTADFGGKQVYTVPGLGIFFDKVGDMVPIVFSQFLRKFCTRQEVTVFFHMRPLSIPSVPLSERYIIQRTSIPSCYRFTVRHGYADEVATPDMGRVIIETLKKYVSSTKPLAGSGGTSSLFNPSPQVRAELEALTRSFDAQTVYIVGKEQMKIRKGSNIFRKLLLAAFIWMRENSRTKLADMPIPTDSLVEVGFVKEI
ncbi:potassium transporter-domain-containing protein [Lipomyces kononenkoae]|uniref:Potassium transporter-domain-containing protein n=1 Tax=Lipomyces kononenkoae TaxID=34357 RepID=A0ACC3SQL8_LIPKO